MTQQRKILRSHTLFFTPWLQRVIAWATRATRTTRATMVTRVTRATKSIGERVWRKLNIKFIRAIRVLQVLRVIISGIGCSLLGTPTHTYMLRRADTRQTHHGSTQG